MLEKQEENLVRVDTHVHMHSCFDQETFLDAAARNLCVAPRQDDQVSGILCLTETSSANWFEEISAQAGVARSENSRWQFESTEESNSCLATHPDSRRIAVLAGRQIVTLEGLEVLALGLDRRFPDGQPTAQVLESVAATGAVPVLPWGFGKWSARRGKLVRDLINNPPCEFSLGDNGGRLSLGPEPTEFAMGRDRGFDILPGSDPFPFSWDQDRVGSFGTEWEGLVSANRPFDGFRSLLLDSGKMAVPFGRLERLPRFVRNQIAIQIRKRVRSSGK